MLHERGLAYQAESLVNYDPVDKTVLANEQVDANGCSWRSGAKVEKIMLKQWFLKIKAFQEPLLKDLDTLAEDGRWPEKVLAMQRNWIGRSEGSQLSFDVKSDDTSFRFNPIEVFTTRADTLFGVQYIALSLSHPIVQRLATDNDALRAFLERAKDMPQDTKEGFMLSEISAENPIAEAPGTSDSSIPIYVAPYVLDDYGSGAVMGVPGHDTRDHAFWRKNAGDAPIKVVISPTQNSTLAALEPGHEDKPYTERGFVAADIATFGNLTSKQAMRKVVAAVRSTGKDAKMTSTWRLRDWLISRQRYWGAPIPIIHCGACGPVPVPRDQLPVELPNLPDSFFKGRTGNPLVEDESWKKTTCPKCGSHAERETDTMDTFMDSSWYFFRFLDSKNEKELVDPKKANGGLPVDLYIGGVEHAILHLLYARFISKFLATTQVWPEARKSLGEPFKRLITQGMVHGETFTDPETGRFLRPDEVDASNPKQPKIIKTGVTAQVSYEKMSKSKYNGVDPGTTIAKYGADATRAHMLFQAPVGDVLEWDEKKIAGVQRWLHRVVRLSRAIWLPDEKLDDFKITTKIDSQLGEILENLSGRRILTPYQPFVEKMIESLSDDDAKLWTKTQQTITSVLESYSRTYSMNTIVSDLMILTNSIWDTPNSSSITPYLKWYSTMHLIRMVAPIAPGVGEEGWHSLMNLAGLASKQSGLATVFASGFPTADLAILDQLTHKHKCVVQIDGKRRFQVTIPRLPKTISPNDTEAVSKFILDELVQTEEGNKWLDKQTGMIWKKSLTGQPHPVYKVVPDDWNVIAVKEGALCNFVSPKTKKASKVP